MNPTRTNPTLSRLGAYLATGIGASTVATSTSDAAIVQIDIGPTGFNIGGVNAGLSSDQYNATFVQNFPFYGAGELILGNNLYNFNITGLSVSGGLMFAVDGAYVPPCSPRNFAQNTSIDSSGFFTPYQALSFFSFSSYVPSPDFGPGSYMGFKTATGNYGWLEVTWDSKLSQFEILSGAYESTPGTAILAGATAAIPEPSSSLLALVAGGAAFARRRRQRAA